MRADDLKGKSVQRHDRSVSLPPPEDGVAVVTGATTGIGAALSTELARRGYDLILVARDEERLGDRAAALATEFGVRATPRPCDLTVPGELAALADELGRTPTSVLCNNAGSGSFGRFVDIDGSRLRQHVLLNVVALHELTNAVLPRMVERRTGAMLLAGSTAGNQPVPGSATYAASKAFVNALASALHYELEGSGVRCTVLVPGPVRTEFASRAGVRGAAARLPSGAWVTPEQAALAGLDALARGKHRIAPGVSGRSLDLLGRLAPSPFSMLVLRRLILRAVGRDR